MLDRSDFTDEIARLYERAEAAAGPPESLRLRARSYLDLYRASNGVCVFALIAAHGAIWASWYLVCAKLAAMVFALFDPIGVYRPVQRYRYFAAYVGALKEINRTVMIATYLIVHGIRDFGPERMVAEGIPAELVHDYARFMSARGATTADLRDLYYRHFLWEQDRIVSDSLESAFAQFDWPFMAALCQRPWVWFSYFRIGRSMNFRRFTDKDERVEKGLLAFDRAGAHGFGRLAKWTERQIVIFNAVLGQSRA